MPFNPNDTLWEETDYMNTLLERANNLPNPENVVQSGPASSTTDSFTAVCNDFLENWHFSMITTPFWEAQVAVYKKLIEKAVTGGDFKSLIQAERLLDCGPMLAQKAAARGDLFQLRIVAGSILGGIIEANELSVSWALQAISYIETKGLPDFEDKIQKGFASEEEVKEVLSIKSGLLRARSRVIGLGKEEPMPVVGAERFEQIKQDTLNELVKTPGYAKPFILLDELNKLNICLFDFTAYATGEANNSKPSSSTTEQAAIIAPVSSSRNTVTTGQSVTAGYQFFAPAPGDDYGLSGTTSCYIL